MSGGESCRCRVCGLKFSRWVAECSNCGSSEIERLASGSGTALRKIAVPVAPTPKPKLFDDTTRKSRPRSPEPAHAPVVGRPKPYADPSPAPKPHPAARCRPAEDPRPAGRRLGEIRWRGRHPLPARMDWDEIWELWQPSCLLALFLSIVGVLGGLAEDFLSRAVGVEPAEVKIEPQESKDFAKAPSRDRASSGSSGSQAWRHPREWYMRQHAVLEKNMADYQAGGYRFDPGSARCVESDMSALRAALEAGNAGLSSDTYGKLQRDYRAFVSTCVWQEGRRHRHFPNIVSGKKPGSWKPDPGYDWVNPGTSDLSVYMKSLPPPCARCKGIGIVSRNGVTDWVTCPSCKGKCLQW